ncbi:MAG: HEAT repeat domain-containing protein, partial [Candidatus Thorarchaeota archaeon]|nr:HEAT repeat domain-containing protein [Candidatus Thorarchaeota archaeon]
SKLLIESKYPLTSVTYAMSKIGKPGLDAISPGLDSENQAVRIAVVSVMQNIGGKRVISLLREALSNNTTEDNVATLKRIITALGELETKDAVEDILPFLNHEDSAVQQVVVDSLKNMKGEQAIDPLVQGLLTCHHWVRKYVAETLGELGWKPSTPEEESWVEFANEEWEKLIARGNPAIEAILQALTDKDEYHRGKILTPLGKTGVTFSDPRIADAILAIYKDKEQADYRKREAIDALSCVPTPKVAKFLIREYSKVERDYLRKGLFNAISNLVIAEFDIASNLISYLKRKKTDILSKPEIEAHLRLFTIIPLTPKQLVNIRPWIASIDIKKLDEDASEVISAMLALELILPKFTDKKFNTRKEALESIEKISIPSAIYPLIEALNDEHYFIREKASKLIGNLGDGAVSKTVAALTNKDPRVRIGAAEALGRLRNGRAAEPLMKALKDKHRIVRQNSAWALGRLYLHYKDYEKLRGMIIKALTKTMKSKDYLPVRFNAVYSLGQLEKTKVVKPLLEAMDYPEKEFRLNATYGFLKLSQFIAQNSDFSSRIVDRLIVTLSDDVDRVRYNAVDGLRFFGGEKASKALEQVKDDQDPQMRELVERAIKEIKNLKGTRRSSWSFSVRSHVQLRDPEVIEELIPFFMDESDEVQRSTQIAISKFGILAFDRMMELLQDTEQHYLIRMGATATFGDIGDKRATDILIETLSDEHDDVRCNAAWALAELKDKRSVKALVKATKDSNWQVRLNAGAALGKIKGKGALDAILKLIEDEHPQVREICTSYLGQFKSPRVLPALKSKLKDKDKKVREIAQSWIDHLEKK